MCNVATRFYKVNYISKPLWTFRGPKGMSEMRWCATSIKVFMGPRILFESDEPNVPKTSES